MCICQSELLELMKANSEDAQDHLHARTCQRETEKGRVKSLEKTLNGHVETTRYANTRKLCIYNMQECLDVMKIQ